MAEVVSSSSVKASALAFGGSSEVSFLAAGTAPGSRNPSLLVYRTSTAYVDGVLPLAARFHSPAAFCRVACSKPTTTSCYSELPTGLISGGLESGVVVVWDPREALLKLSDSASSSTIFEDYFCQKDVLPQQHDTIPNLIAAKSNDDEMLQLEDGGSEEHGLLFSPFKIIDTISLQIGFHSRQI